MVGIFGTPPEEFIRDEWNVFQLDQNDITFKMTLLCVKAPVTASVRCTEGGLKRRPFVVSNGVGQKMLFSRSVVRFAQDEDKNAPPKRKKLTRETEPDQYWISKGEREGANPMKDPLAIIGLIAIFTPFVILGIAIAVGYVDVNP